MLNYEKLSKSSRTRTAMLLLLLFMVLAVADLFISFFGGLVLGVLLVQFELEAQRFCKRSFFSGHRKTGVLKAYHSLGRDQKLYFKAGLQALIFILLMAHVLDSFWAGLLSGLLLPLIADDLARYQRHRSRQKITINKN
ncbi:hypothetical protein [Pontibacter mangrovi]|uniref:Uncharacterized protein n=1 Tax=Pontibacter mangrovi TaxID=2589816 RepID=A0A501W323_9BACT|nr:hypothetical protein [Pontibacter mangrovi]TPE44009.1 hypothetical protein FJM65_11340 [Pontibacter mangrovi]